MYYIGTSLFSTRSTIILEFSFCTRFSSYFPMKIAVFSFLFSIYTWISLYKIYNLPDDTTTTFILDSELHQTTENLLSILSFKIHTFLSLLKQKPMHRPAVYPESPDVFSNTSINADRVAKEKHTDGIMTSRLYEQYVTGKVRFVIHVFAWRRSVSLKRLLDSLFYAKYFKGLDNLSLGT